MPRIKQSDPEDQKRQYIDLEVAHLLGMTWAGLYLRGLFTYDFFHEGCDMLWTCQNYARCSILNTILTLTQKEALFAAKFLFHIGLVKVRQAMIWHLSRIHQGE